MQRGLSPQFWLLSTSLRTHPLNFVFKTYNHCTKPFPKQAPPGTDALYTLHCSCTHFYSGRMHEWQKLHGIDRLPDQFLQDFCVHRSSAPLLALLNQHDTIPGFALRNSYIFRGEVERGGYSCVQLLHAGEIPKLPRLTTVRQLAVEDEFAPGRDGTGYRDDRRFSGIGRRRKARQRSSIALALPFSMRGHAKYERIQTTFLEIGCNLCYDPSHAMRTVSLFMQ